ncbi:MAG: GNAT family N-acetyltransferase [Caldilineaceae bacterium]
MNTPAQSPLIKVRRTEPSDYVGVQRIFSMPRAVWGTLQIPYPSAEMWRKRFAEPPEGSYQLVACVDEEVIGHTGLHTFPNNPRRRHVGQIGMAVRDDWQGKGVGTALMQAVVDLADKWLNLSRLELDVFVDNEPAIRLYKRFGFQIEGTFVRFAFRDGEYVDTYTMARLRSE